MVSRRLDRPGACFLLFFAIVGIRLPVLLAESTAAPSPRRVVVSLEVEGELFANAAEDTDPVRTPIAVEARFEFQESAAVDAGTAGSDVSRTYADAVAVMRVDGQESRTDLAADARTLLVARRGTTPVPFLPDACLSRDEADLLETPFDSILLDDLLPREPQAVGAVWQVAPDLAAGLLAIDTVENSTLEARLLGVVDGVAQVSLAGVVDGAADGVPTHVVVEGTFSAAARPDEDLHLIEGGVLTLAATLLERRQASHVAPGFEVEAEIAVTRSVEPPAEDADAGVATDGESGDAPGLAALRRQGEGKPGLVWHRDGEARFDLVYDRNWRTVAEDAAGLVLRLVDHGALVAQCSITTLPRTGADVAPTVQEVQRDIRQSLAGQFARFDDTSSEVRADGVTVLRIASAGTAEGLPFRWIHYVLTDAEGRRAGVTFMLEASLEKRFGDADRALVEGLRFLAPAPREARAPRATLVP